MRLPKFRIKDNKDSWRYFTVLHSGINVENFKKDTLGESTELKDKNGVEIYDGDIIRWGMNGIELSGVRYAIVELFTSLSFKLLFYEDEKTGEIKYPKRPYSFDFSNFIYTDTKKYLEVVGNIYENKEFLND